MKGVCPAVLLPFLAITHGPFICLFINNYMYTHAFTELYIDNSSNSLSGAESFLNTLCIYAEKAMAPHSSTLAWKIP